MTKGEFMGIVEDTRVRSVNSRINLHLKSIKKYTVVKILVFLQILTFSITNGTSALKSG